MCAYLPPDLPHPFADSQHPMFRAPSMAAAAVSQRFVHSSSGIVTRQLNGSHRFTIGGYKLSKKIPRDWKQISPIFEVAGYSWRIAYSPHGFSSYWSGECDCISLFLQLTHGEYTDPPLHFSFTLLDQAGNPVPRYSRSKEGCTFTQKESDLKNVRCIGFYDFIRHKDLEESGCLKDDCFTVRCDISVIRCSTSMETVVDSTSACPTVTVPPSDLHKHLNNLLWEKKGTDVTFDVDGETFHAHKWLLAARSPVFKVAIALMTKDDKPSSICHMKIDGIEPKVFKAMLHFMYTDSLPNDMQLEDQDTTAVQNLIAAAQRYELERLKLMCEEALCNRIDVSTVTATLALAAQHHCHALKAACIEFIGHPRNLRAIVETQGFKKMKAKTDLLF
ncbi:hypothetical protein EJB05_29703, partial [Eragrostis curvula]